jgi:hypothetical protein
MAQLRIAPIRQAADARARRAAFKQGAETAHVLFVNFKQECNIFFS